tara:strand:- start:164 stop:355 length:192 start_codon:yes stop_codon:yes gene_type:complete
VVHVAHADALAYARWTGKSLFGGVLAVLQAPVQLAELLGPAMTSMLLVITIPGLSLWLPQMLG